MTTDTHLDILDRSVEKTNIWINEVAAEMATTDRHEAYRVLRAFLHTLRDRLPIAEAAQDADLLRHRGAPGRGGHEAGRDGRELDRRRGELGHRHRTGDVAEIDRAHREVIPVLRREAAEHLELLYGDRWRDPNPLSKAERVDVLRGAIEVWRIQSGQIEVVETRDIDLGSD